MKQELKELIGEYLKAETYSGKYIVDFYNWLSSQPEEVATAYKNPTISTEIG